MRNEISLECQTTQTGESAQGLTGRPSGDRLRRRLALNVARHIGAFSTHCCRICKPPGWSWWSSRWRVAKKTVCWVVRPLAADESSTDRASLAHLVGRYQFVNIKLDKCGGLTEGLALAAQARRLGLGLMVGNMCGTSLAMAPAFLLAQQCRYVDLDGPLLQTEDRAYALNYRGGEIQVPGAELWG